MVLGLETLKTLVGAISVPSFTVADLADRVGVASGTVGKVVKAHERLFDSHQSLPDGQPGRPPVVWSLRSEHARELVAIVEEMQASIGQRGAASTEAAANPALVQPSLILAMGAVVDAFVCPVDEVETLLAASRNYLITAGFDADGTPWSESVDANDAVKARLIARAADVVEAGLIGDQQVIDRAQLRVIPDIREATPIMSAAEWLPLARGVVSVGSTALSSPVLVESRWHERFAEQFPSLVSCGWRAQELHWHDRQVECWLDSRIPEPLADQRPISIVYDWVDEAGVDFWADAHFSHTVIVVPGNRADTPAVVLESGATVVHETDPSLTRKSIAAAVNRIAVGLG